ncbi:MAG: diguanylate cyclase [Macromonas bipunctata]|nr:diguanylate cyclase [Macromonas bipunctata]
MPIAIDDLPSACLVSDDQGHILCVNAEMLQLCGKTAPELLHQPLDVLLSTGSKVFFQTHVWPTLRKEGHIREIFMHLQSAHAGRLPLYLSARRACIDQQLRYVWQFCSWQERSRFEAELVEARRQAQASAEQMRDAHERLRNLHLQLEQKVLATQAQYQSAAELAYLDSLTRLGNRRSLQAAATALTGEQAAQGFSVLMVDVDHFKSINDRYGHDRGDVVLQGIARCLQHTARQGDTAVRYGGEEFCLVLPGANPAQAMQVAQRLHDEIGRQRPGDLDITISVGAATALDTLDDLFTVLKRADEALYAAKRQGRNRSLHRNDIG